MNTLALNNILHINSIHLDDSMINNAASMNPTINYQNNISSKSPGNNLIHSIPNFLKTKKRILPTNNLYSLELIEFETPISLVSYLIREIEKSLISKFKLIWRNKEKVEKVTLHFYHKKTKRLHMIKIKPAKPSIELDDFIEVLEDELKNITLDIPINSVEIEVQRNQI